MAMGKRMRDRQPAMWVPTTEWPTAASHPFYARLNQILSEQRFDDFVEAQCAGFYAETLGRPGLAPGIYFRLLLVGYFEGIDSERGIAWRAADSLTLRDFLGLTLPEAPPDHSTISRTRRLIDLETHRAVFTWVLARLGEAGLVQGQTIGVDATTLEANAALRSIVRRDTGEGYHEFLTTLAQASDIETPTRADLARLDRTRKKKGSNDDWTSPSDPDAKITKMKDGRTHLAHKAEHAVDLDTGAIVGVTVQDAHRGDRRTFQDTLAEAVRQLDQVTDEDGEPVALADEVVSDKGCHSRAVLRELREQGFRTYISEPDRRRHAWTRQTARTRGRLRQSATHSRRPRDPPLAPPRRVSRTHVCARLRDRRDAAHAPARARQHPQARARASQRLQSRARHAPPAGRGHPTWPAGPRRGGDRAAHRRLLDPPHPAPRSTPGHRRSRSRHDRFADAIRLRDLVVTMGTSTTGC
jgi:transposase